MYTLEQWACNRLKEDADFDNKIIFSDEAHLDLGGYVNKKTRTQALKSRRTQNELLFGAVFGPEA